MKLTRMLLALSSIYLLVLLPDVSCVDTITVGADPKTKKKNPYIEKFHESVNRRPTKCQGR